MSQQGSFIPKSPINSKVSNRRVRKIYIVTYLVYVLFFGTIIAAAGTWFYTSSLTNDLAAKQLQLEAAEQQFAQSDLERVAELEERLEIAQELLDNRVSIVAVLNAIEETTVSNVLMNEFTFGVNESDVLELQMVANANNFNDALFQRTLFKDNSILAGASITNVEYGEASESGESAAAPDVSFTIQKVLNAEARAAMNAAAVTPITPITPITAVPDASADSEIATSSNDEQN